jgi:hypothetical protein
MAKPVVEVVGAKELAREFKRAGGNVRDLSGAYRTIARELVPPAKRNAPRRSGRLEASTRGAGTKTAAILRAGSARVPYAGVIHFGNPTKKSYPGGTLGVIRPNPWLYRTTDQRRDEVVDLFDKHVGDVLRRNGLAD